ncbi:exodeoxyribonuclease VII small subunit [Puia sp. P3]|uniref:exodeoxyribonuclease VII small subunit n=1 Tax=Puia sp. P3 TaxID=3423952 RepID=UPI003D67400D
MEPTFTYEEAYRELAAIAREIESESVAVDVLAQKVRRASELITWCQTKLRTSETEVNKIISQMDKQPLTHVYFTQTLPQTFAEPFPALVSTPYLRKPPIFNIKLAISASNDLIYPIRTVILTIKRKIARRF